VRRRLADAVSASAGVLAVTGDRTNTSEAPGVLNDGAACEGAGGHQFAEQEDVLMRRLIFPIIAVAIAAAPLALEAQTPRAERGQAGMRAGGVGNPAERVLRHREALSLTADQVRQLEQLQARFAAENRPLLDQVRAVRPEFGQREAREGMRPRAERLTEEQREQLRQRREQMAQASPEERAALRAELREEMRQRAAARTPEERQEMRERMRGARANPEVRAQMDALRPVMQQLRENHTQAREQVQAVLTTEQTAKLRELWGQRGGIRGEGMRRGPRSSRR
jgi:hypothetical protein